MGLNISVKDSGRKHRKTNTMQKIKKVFPITNQSLIFTTEIVNRIEL